MYTIVSVSDDEEPVIHGMPGNIFNLVTVCGNSANVLWTEPTVTDNSGYSTLSSVYIPGDSFPYGDTSVTYTATDDSGNTVSQSITVTVMKQTGM